MKTFPTLLKRGTKGQVLQWTISVVENSDHSTAYDIFTVYGQLDGKLQTTTDTIFEGKNIGKTNETSPEEQAMLEAKSKWTKQIKRNGYVESLENIDKDLRPGIEPMLAHRYDKHPDKMEFPAFIQPKLDGHRCIAVIKDGVCKLYSRKHSPITGLPHIILALESFFLNAVLDGELYNHDYKSKFEELTGFIRSEEPKEGHEVVQYHIYDLASNPDQSFSKRAKWLTTLSKDLENSRTLKIVDTIKVEQSEVVSKFKEYLAQGYEGAILRNPSTPYENKRSYGLQKVKEFDDAEFLITDIKEGRGKLKGHAIFECTIDPAYIGTFDVKMKGDMETLKEIFENQDKYIGKLLTVQFQGRTKNNIPRFPVGLRFREDV